MRIRHPNTCEVLRDLPLLSICLASQRCGKSQCLNNREMLRSYGHARGIETLQLEEQNEERFHVVLINLGPQRVYIDMATLTRKIYFGQESFKILHLSPCSLVITGKKGIPLTPHICFTVLHTSVCAEEQSFPSPVCSGRSHTEGNQKGDTFP